MNTFEEYLEATSKTFKPINENQSDSELRKKIFELLDGRQFTDPDDDLLTYMTSEDAEELTDELLKAFHTWLMDNQQ